MKRGKYNKKIERVNRVQEMGNWTFRKKRVNEKAKKRSSKGDESKHQFGGKAKKVRRRQDKKVGTGEEKKRVIENKE